MNIGAKRQLQLLDEEGSVFVKDRVDWKRHEWRGLEEANELRQETLF
jgi:hypothetical protein